MNLQRSFVIVHWVMIASLILLSSCNSSPDNFRHFEDKYIEFGFPEAWRVEKDLTQEKVKMYEIHDTLKFSSFGIYITLDEGIPLGRVNRIQKIILEDFIPNAERFPSRDTVINGERGVYFTYVYDDLLTYKGTYLALKNNDHTLNIHYQYSLDEEERVKKEIKEVVKSIDCHWPEH